MAKVYGYRQITAATEKKIQELADFARNHRNDYDSHQLARNWANGAVMLWAAVTMGRQKPGDRERLEAMAAAIRIGQPAAEDARS